MVMSYRPWRPLCPGSPGPLRHCRPRRPAFAAAVRARIATAAPSRSVTLARTPAGLGAAL